MKKTLRILALLLLPVLFYYGIFFAFEPNNYFGLQESASGTDIMAALRQYERQPQDSIILGDSRLAKLEPAPIKETPGANFQNLAFGGASLSEQLDVLDWVMEQNTGLRQVVFGLSFYTLNGGYSHNRNIILALQNPLAYLTNLGYNINMLTNLYDHLLPHRQVGDAGETMPVEEYEYVPYLNETTGKVYAVRKTIAEHLTALLGRTENWRLDEAGLARLLDTIALCRQRGVRFVLVFPPAHADVLTHIVQSYGIDKGMAAARAAIPLSMP